MRAVALTIQFGHIAANSLNKGVLQDFFDDLPDDAILYQTYSNMGDMIFYFESQQFRDIDPSTPLPEITYKINQLPVGSHGPRVTLDLSACLDPANTPTACAKCLQNNCICTPACPCNGAGACYKCILNNPSTWANYKHVTFNPEDLKIDYSKSISIPKASCSHEWKFYQGLNEMFDYCSKCNEKKK